MIGTVGILERAANIGLISDLKKVHDELRQTDFRIAVAVLEASYARHLGFVLDADSTGH